MKARFMTTKNIEAARLEIERARPERRIKWLSMIGYTPKGFLYEYGYETNGEFRPQVVQEECAA